MIIKKKSEFNKYTVGTRIQTEYSSFKVTYIIIDKSIKIGGHGYILKIVDERDGIYSEYKINLILSKDTLRDFRIIKK